MVKLPNWMAHRLASDAGPDSARDGTEPTSDSDDESSDDERDVSASLEDAPIKRREWLTAMGVIVAAPAVGTGVARADTQGYGAGEYGSGPYGDPVDEDDEEIRTIAVETHEVADVDNPVTLRGELTELEGYDEAVVYFEWDESDGGLSRTTDEQTLESTGGFDDEITDLESDTEYEFRAVVESGDESDTGDTLSFITEPEEEEEEELDAVPEILRLDVEDISNPRNPHVDISIEWQAAIDEGELDSAEMLLYGTDSGAFTWNYDLSGQSAERSETERIHRGSGETYTVYLTVYSGHDTSESEYTTFQSQ